MATAPTSKRHLGLTSSTYVSTSDVTIGGNLVVDGNTVTLNTVTLEVEDKNILLNKGGTKASADGAGFNIFRGTSSVQSFIWSDSNSRFELSHPLKVTTSLYVTDSGYTTDANYVQFNTPSGYVQVGAMNTSHAHIYTDRPSFYTNKPILISGDTVLTTASSISGSKLPGGVFQTRSITVGKDTDWDTLIEQGTYGVASSAGVQFAGNNAPPNADYRYGHVVVTEDDGQGIRQTYYPHSGVKMFTRTGWSNASWNNKGWHEHWTSLNHPTTISGYGITDTFAPSDAEKNVQSDWNSTSGDSQILNKPTIPSAFNGGTVGNAFYAPTIGLDSSTADTNSDKITVYDNGGSVSYGMTLWNTNGTSGEWATMIYGPNQSSRRISFGKANANFTKNHAGIDELAWLDLDNGNYFTDGNIYPGGSTSKYVSTGRIDNWNDAHSWGDHSKAGYLTSAVTTETNSFLGDGGDASTHPGTSRLIYTGQVSAGGGALGMPTVNNANAFITLNKHSGEYNSQLGFSSNGHIYYRNFNNAAINGTQAWHQIWTSNNLTNNSSNWDTAYGWGDHADAGYVTSSGVTTETDPVYKSERDDLRLNKMAHSTLLWSTLADYNRPSGYSTMIQPNSHKNPLPSHGYYHIIARRDGEGGYGALLQAYNSHELFHGNTTKSTNEINWYNVWNSGDFAKADVTEGTTAYSWGDHSLEGYSKTDTTYNFAGTLFTSRNSTNGIAIDSANSNMSGYTNTSTAAGYADGGLFVAAYSSNWVSQIFSNFRTGELSARGKNSGTWQAWRKIHDSGHFSTTDVANGVTAHGWGDHSKAGYLTALPAHNHDSSYLGKTAKAADSEKLDGLDSTKYLRDNGWNNSPGQDADTQVDQSVDFTYSNNAPNTGPLVRMGASNYSMQFNSTYSNDAGGLAWRSYNNDSAKKWNPWRTIYHSGVFTNNSSNWDTAYGWGDHSKGGYLTSFDITTQTDAKYLRSNANDTFTHDLVSNARNRGIFGTYDSTKTDHIWSMGTSYRNSSTGADFGNLYGLAYKHTNNTTGGTMAGGHQMVWCQNGSPGSAMGTNIWTSGTVKASGGNSGEWNTAYGWGNHASAGYVNQAAVNASHVDQAKGLSEQGFGTDELTFYQTANGYANFKSGWAHYIISNHGNGYSYYNVTDIRPFWGAPQYSRQEGTQGVWKGPFTYWTEENFTPSSYSVKSSTETLSGSKTFSNSYNEFGNGHGSVSNDGNWNARVNVAGSSHARLDVKSVSDGIITTMYSHTGHAAGKVGTMSNHKLDFMINGSSKARLETNGTFRAAGDVVAYYSFSDRRLKTKIEPLENNLEKVLGLHPVSYQWKEGDRKGKTDIGLIAQEVEEIVPEVVREQGRLEEDGTNNYKTVDYEHLVSVLIGAVKEQQEQIDILKKQMKECHGK